MNTLVPKSPLFSFFSNVNRPFYAFENARDAGILDHHHHHPRPYLTLVFQLFCSDVIVFFFLFVSSQRQKEINLRKERIFAPFLVLKWAPLIGVVAILFFDPITTSFHRVFWLAIEL